MRGGDAHGIVGHARAIRWAAYGFGYADRADGLPARDLGGAGKESFEAIATFGLLGMCNWLSQWYKSSGQYSHRQIAAMFVNMVEKSLILSPLPL